ncbi:MAG: tRNA threonylcarbamoyladenosine dehydratase [Lachnospiraceae bacterium]|nr:tRNA threonylcarbamoyladenosine dehydratase [Lachnospiraceae bacterium]
MSSRFEREELLIGKDGLSRLADCRVLLFGVGGVGGYTAECLARAGIGHITIVDADKVDITNINRQILALGSTVGRYKVDVCRERLLDINPGIDVVTKNIFYLPGMESEFSFGDYDYIADCIDTVAAKVDIICQAQQAGTPVISAMGAAGKLDPSLFTVTDISKTSYCPLAKVMRRELRKKGVTHLKVVYSPESPIPPEEGRRPGTLSFVPAACGITLAGAVINDLLEKK